MSDEYPAQYLEGLRLFNRREFFACHDVLEELWSETVGREREFYQGLIQAAVALFHFEEGNLGGACRMHESACRYLQPYRPRFQGIDLERFLAEFRECFRDLLAAKGEYPAHVSLDAGRIPKLILAEGATAGREEPR